MTGMRVNKYFPFAFVYFFINGVALPFGLTYTSLLAPFFYIWIIRTRKREVLLPFIAVLVPFMVMHLLVVRAELNSYLVSLLNLVLVYIFCQTAYSFLLVCQDVEKIFRWILFINFVLCIVAIPFYFTEYFSLFWDEQVLTEGVGRLRRLRLFTYEPSYYSFLFTPFFFFFLLQYFFRQNTIPAALLLPMIMLPYLLSFSIGVMGAMFLALFFTWILYFKQLITKKRIINTIITGGVTLASVLVVLLVFFRSNPLFTRIANIFNWRDTSGRGRTADAFILARKILYQGNEFWGIGLGQIKTVGDSIIRDYYLYNIDIVATIPNAAAETLAIFGWVGFIVRIALELFLFFYTRVWTNYYRLLLFFFVFIYQFTGSFITNAAEYMIWILAFTNIFSQFNVAGGGDPAIKLKQVRD